MVKKQIIEFYDENEVFGRIQTKEDIKVIQELYEEYKNQCYRLDEGYNIDDFLRYLEDHGLKFKTFQTIADIQLYF